MAKCEKQKRLLKTKKQKKPKWMSETVEISNKRREPKGKKDKNHRKEFSKQFQTAVIRDKKQHYNKHKKLRKVFLKIFKTQK